MERSLKTMNTTWTANKAHTSAANHLGLTKVLPGETIRDSLLRERIDANSPLSRMSAEAWDEFLSITSGFAELLGSFEAQHLLMLRALIDLTVCEKYMADAIAAADEGEKI